MVLDSVNSPGIARLEKSSDSENVSGLSIVAMIGALCLVLVVVVGGSIMTVNWFGAERLPNEWEQTGAVHSIDSRKPLP